MSVSIVIVTGLSGSGMSSALKVFEDLGYFAVDNLPVQLIPTFNQLCADANDIPKTAFVVDVRSPEFVQRFPEVCEHLKQNDADVRVLFLEADDEVLLRRYSETRRPHPLPQQDVVAAIRQERELLADIRELADVIIDTSELSVHGLRDVIRERFGGDGSATEMSVALASFGFRHGLPRGLDMLLDVRFLPNPHFIADLRPLTGRDEAVIKFLDAQCEVGESIERFADLLLYLLPKFRREGKSYLSIGIGCTGGRHRSVRVAEALHERLAGLGYKTKVTHRDIDKDERRYKN